MTDGIGSEQEDEEPAATEVTVPHEGEEDEV